jgi:methyl-accepting chemotaxis protein
MESETKLDFSDPFILSEDMYVTDPILNKTNTFSYTAYTLQGKKIPEPLIRRYRDFAALRAKLVENWPGFFIPNIPHKQIIGSKNNEIIEMRIELINRFCTQISKIDYLFNSEEMNIFLTNTTDVIKLFNNCKTKSYNELLKKYSEIITNYDDNFDIENSKKEQEKFYKLIKENYPRIKSFKQLIINSRDKYKNIHDNYTSIINILSLYEKETLKDYCNNDENKLIFYNSKNENLLNNIEKIRQSSNNPYDRLLDSISEDYLYTEAMIESFDSLKELNEKLNKLKKKFLSLNADLVSLQSGNKIKNKEEIMNNLSTQKNNLENEINDLEKIIKIVTFNMNEQIKKFKTHSLNYYYKELLKLEEDTDKFGKDLENLWESTLDNDNIKQL